MSLTHAKLSDFTWPNDSFGRSVNVKIGLTDNSNDASFHFTQKSLTLLKNILDSTQLGPRDRAFSIIGPYGAGKSSFGLFIASLLSRSRSSWLDRTLQHLSEVSPDLSKRALTTTTSPEKGYIPIVIQGQKGSINLSLCQSLIDALCTTGDLQEQIPVDFQESLLLARESIQSGLSSTTEVLELFRSATEKVKLMGFSGLVVIADEFGKFLERAGDEGNVPDLVAIQYLAELASSNKESNLILLVLLHQSFRDYASTISESERVEWNKIQGRFEQVDFSEEAEELYPLIAACLNRNANDKTDELVQKWADQTYKSVEDIPLFKKSSTWPDILPQVYPFHPVSLYGLPRLSSRLAQNERTLFNFLVSEDPLGFRRYLSGTSVESNALPSMTFDTVVDYFLYGLRFASWSPDIRKSISQLESAMERLGDRPAIEEKIIKILGGIRLLRCGPALPSTAATLKACLNILTDNQHKGFDDALANLIEQKLVVFRVYSEEYHLWEGSDFDFDTSIEKTRNEIRNLSSIYERIPSEIKSRPVLANTYAMKTGTSRSFQRHFKSCQDFSVFTKNGDEVNHIIKESLSNGFDGVIIHTMPSTVAEIAEIKSSCIKGLGPRIIVTVPQIPSGSAKLLDDLNVLNQITKENPQIFEDPVALKELEARIDSLSAITEESVLALIEPRAKGPNWWWNCKPSEITNGSEANALLSEICTYLYQKAPNIKNELINRSILSTPVVTATKKIAAQLTEHSEYSSIPRQQGSQLQLSENLIAFSGNGPEVSIFKSVFKNTGIYKNGTLGSPSDDDSNLSPVWDQIGKFLKDSKKSSRSLEALFAILQDSPYGVKRGLIPILIWAALISHKDTVCLYYDGTYVRIWDVETYELFEKIPHKYSVRWIDSEQSVQTISKGMWQTLDSSLKTPATDKRSRIGINSLLSALFTWYRELPEYSKNTKRLEKESLNFRQVITSTSDPVDLLFSKIPIALGCTPLLDDSGEITRKLRKERSVQLIAAFGNAISEISKAYEKLQNDMLKAMANRIGGEPHWSAIQENFQDCFDSLGGYLHDERYLGFMISAISNSDRNQTTWLERIGTHLLGHSLRDWSDDDIHKFDEDMAILRQILQDARRRERATNQDSELPRIYIEPPNSEPVEIILPIRNNDSSVKTTANIRVKIEEINHLLSNANNLNEETKGKLRLALAQLLIDTL